MPSFPGLANAENCRDWNPGIPINLDLIRPKDETYWDVYRGTPKGFISLEAARNTYGVVLNTEPELYEVDYSATDKLRAELKAS